MRTIRVARRLMPPQIRSEAENFRKAEFTSAEDFDPPQRGPRVIRIARGMDCPPAAQEKAIAAAKAMAEE